MSAELIGILAVGAALATLNLTTLRGLRTEIRGDIRGVRGELHAVRDELRGELHAVRDGLRGDIRNLDDRMRTQERSAAKLEGHLEGLREAVVVRTGPWSGATGSAPAGGSEQAQG